MHIARARPLLATQLALTVVVFGAIAVMPPVQGRILLVPLSHEAGQRLASEAVGHGGRIVARGPAPQSLVVEGNRARLFELAGAGVLLLQGRGMGCGVPMETFR